MQDSKSATRDVRRGSVRNNERSLAPDFGRGLMLLLIVMSNTAFYLWAAEHGPSGWHPVDGSVADTVVQYAMITGLDMRVYPLFAFLFGYGMVQLFRRQTDAGATERGAVALLRRRSLWLLVFGFAHAALLMAGDILGAYGLASLVLGWLFLRRGDRTLLWAATVAMVLTLLLLVLTVLEVAGQPGDPQTVPTIELYAADETDPVAAAVTRISTWVFGVTFFGALLGFAMHAAILLGFWAARRRVLDEPAAHLPLLRWTAAIGIPIGWLGAQPAALAHIGVLDLPPAAMGEEGPLFMLQTLSGLPAGLGYAALVGLLAHRMSSRARRSVPVVAVAAVGKRSLSCYFAHSVIFSPLLAAWGLGLGAFMGSATMALFATGVWLVTVAGAYALERSGRNGPAEVLLRRLTYGRRTAEPAPPPDRSAA